MKTKLFLLSFLSIIISDCAFSQTWSSGANILKSVRGGNIAAYSKNNEGYLFIVSGREESGMVKTVQRYTISTNKWDTLQPHTTGLLGAAVTILKDNLYIIGGVINPPGFGQDSVYKFDINHNVWSRAASYPYDIVDAKAVPYQDSLIYTAGGLGGPDGANVLVYNASTDLWRVATSIPSAEGRNFGGFAIAGNTLIYMCGTDGFGSDNYFNTVYIGTISQTDRSLITWKLGASFPGKTRSFFDAHTWSNNSIIMTGGSTDNTFDTWSDECYLFNPDKNTWTKLPNKPTAWLTGQSGSVHLQGNIWKLVCAGGYNGAYIPQAEILTVTDTPSAVAHIAGTNCSSLLFQNAPNPFGTVTVINYEISRGTEEVTLTIYDAQGKQVEVLVKERQNPGTYAVNYNAIKLPPGVYYYKLTTGEVSETKKMTRF